MRLSYRPHYASCASVRPSVCPFVSPARARKWKIKKRRKAKIGINFPQRTSTWSGKQFSVKKVKYQGYNWMSKTLEKSGAMFIYWRWIKRRRRLQDKLNLLLAPEDETLGNWTDGRTSCRLLTPTCF